MNINMKLLAQIALLTAKIILIFFLSNADQSFFVYQNF